MAFLQTFTDEASKNVRESLRDKFESGTGIIGQTFRERREKAERQQEIDEQVSEINLKTTKIAATGATLRRIENAFLQISDNIQVLAKSMDAYATTREETNKALGKQAQQVTQPTTTAATPPAAVKELVDNREEKYLFDKISGMFDRFSRRPKPSPKKPPGKGPVSKGKQTAKTVAEKTAGKTATTVAGKEVAKKAGKEMSKSAIKAAARKALAKTIGKIGAKSIPIIGIGVGAAFAVGRLLEGDVTGAGIEVAGGLAGPLTSIPADITNAARDIFFEEYGHYPDPRDPDDVVRLRTIYEGVKETAEEMLGQKVEAPKAEEAKKPAPSATPLPSGVTPSTAGGGRGSVNPPVVVPEPAPAEQPSLLGRLFGKKEEQPQQVVGAPIPAAALPAPTPTTKPATAATTAPPKTGGGGEFAMESAIDAEGFDPKAKAAIMAQVSHESGHFKFLQEDLSYSASSLQKIFGKYFRDPETAKQYERKPEMIANRVYANRMGNGPEESGDGYRYRGRGFIQLTGRKNYTQASKDLGIDLVGNPDLASQPANAAKIAIWFFKTNLKRITDWANVTEVTQVVNGGLNGLEDRKREFAAYLSKYNLPSAVGGTAPTTGMDVGQQSTVVAAAKKPAGGNNVTVIAVNNTTEVRRAASPQPRKESTTMVG